jgi:Tol biopolymer transport system component
MFSAREIGHSRMAENLVPADTNETSDVFVHDLQTGQTLRVSVASDGSQGRAYSSETAISGDGRVVAFASDAINLVPLDTNQQRDVFVYDRDAEEAPGP